MNNINEILRENFVRNFNRLLLVQRRRFYIELERN